MRTTLSALIIGLMSLGVFTASVAHAEPSCVHLCVVDPTPKWPGQLQPTWELPPYGSWGRTPVQCNPVSQHCEVFAPGTVV